MATVDFAYRNKTKWKIPGYTMDVCHKLVCWHSVGKKEFPCASAVLLSRQMHRGFTWVSKGKGCSLPLASISSVLSISDNWSPPPLARPHSLQSPHSAGPPVRITTSQQWIFHYIFLSECWKLATSSGICDALLCLRLLFFSRMLF